MSCLDATFTLTPRSPSYSPSNGTDWGRLHCAGADYRWTSTDLPSLYASDRFHFNSPYASDPNLDYAQYANRKKARFIEVYISLYSYRSTQKQLALIFGFEVEYPPPFDQGRVLVYTDAGLLRDQKLVYGDNQLLFAVESIDQPLNFYFIHAGGSWFFKGLSAYVV